MLDLQSDRYTIRRSLGAGGMGVVYAAWDEDRGCEVALKTLRRMDPSAVYRFKREFRALATTRHPNLVSLYELVASGDRVFFTMEMVEGQDFLRYVGHPTWPGADTQTGDPSLAGADGPPPRLRPPPRNLARPAAGAGEPADRTRPWLSSVDGPTKEPQPLPRAERTTARHAAVIGAAQPLPARMGFDGSNLVGLSEERLRHATRQLVEGIDALHALGCLHRDIKPSNVLVTPEGRLVLLDLGLVTWTHSAEASVERYVAGTAAYMSPEQAAAKPLTEASDYYSVGVMLYEGLVGSRPFRGTFDQIVSAKQVGEPPPPSRVVDGVPADLDALCVDLLATDPAARPGAREILERLGPISLPPQSLSDTGFTAPIVGVRTDFVGREEQLAALRDAWDRSTQGRCVTVHLHGASGMGKSALLRTFLDERAEGRERSVILSGRCYEHESVAFKAVDGLVDSLSGYLRGLPRARVELLLPQDVGPLARLFPVLRQVEPIALARHRADTPDPLELRRRAFRALRQLLHRIAERRPLVLCVDDLQWGDLDSSQLLADLTRPPDAPPLLLLACYRSADLESSPHIRLLREAQGLRPRATSPGSPLPAPGDEGADVLEVEVQPLGRAACEELARELLGGEGLEVHRQAAAVAAESQGNPYFVHELVHFVHSEGSDLELQSRTGGSAGAVRFARRVRLEDLLRARLESLPPGPRALLVTLAVAGRPLPRSIAAQAAGIQRGDLDAIDLLQGVHLIRTRDTADGLSLEPYHDRIREAIVEELSPTAARERHLRLAITLEGSRYADSEALAEHFAGAGHLEKAGDHAVDAARAAGGALAFDRSAMLFRFAMRLLPPDQVIARGIRPALAEALARAGRARESAEVFGACVEETSGTERLQNQLRCAEEYLRSGRVEEGLAALGGVLGELRMSMPGSTGGAIASLLARRARLKLRGLGWTPREPGSLAPLEAARIDACWTVASGLGMIDPVRGADFQTRNLLLSLESGDAGRVARSLAMEAMYQSTSGRRGRDRAAAILRDAAALSERLGDPKLRGLCTFAAGMVAYEGGEWSRARDLHLQADRIFLDACAGVTLEVATNRHFLVLALLQLGEVQDLARRVPDYILDAEDRGDRFTATSFRNGCMNIAWLVDDDVKGARAAVGRAMSPWAPTPFYLQHYEGLYAQVTIDLYAGDGVAAWRRVQAQWPELKGSQLLAVQQLRLEALFFRGRSALAAAGASAEDLPSPAQLVAEAEAAARAIERTRMAWARPLAAMLRAGAARQRGQPDAAIVLLGEAIGQLELQDMRLYAASARRRRARLIGGPDGRAGVEQADQWFGAQGVRDPAAMARLFAPGLDAG